MQKTFLIHAIINGLEYQIYLHDDLNLLVFFIIGIHSINVVVCLSRQAVMWGNQPPWISQTAPPAFLCGGR